MNLHNAAKSGDLESVIDLHERGISLDIRDDHQNTPLHYAAKHGHYLIASFLIDNKCVLNVANSDGNTPLSIAVGAGHYQLSDLLLKSGAVANLHLACQAGWLDQVRTFVASEDYNINARNSDGETTLSLAARYVHKDVVEFLIHSGADANCLINIELPFPFTDGNWTLLHFACQMDWFDIVKAIVETNRGVDLEVKTRVGDTPLAIAARSGALKIAEFLIRSGADIHSFTNENDWSILHSACQMEYPDIVRAIVERYPGYNVNVKCSDRQGGYTPLLFAARYAKKDMVNLFLELGADVNACDTGKKTLLHFSCNRRWPDVIKKCIEAGADVNAQNIFLSTPLHLACRRGNMEIMKLLLDAGANINTRSIAALNVVLKSAHHYCAPSDCRCPNLVRLLMNHGAIFDDSAYTLAWRNEDLKRNVLGDVDICTQAFINQYNNVDLPSIYSIPSSVKLPSIKKLKIKASQGAAREIEKFVANEVEAKGFCDVVKKCPLVLQILSVRSFMIYKDTL
ncbi:hypothetical protein JTE90_027873 [Oedothorax gibbosus]|uniref:Ankyrin repeat protein n=1 Tax=Oedothorax gibbosus TaxID=931172 RepID=A0AAV6U8C8_9ARAC|nr:hypothetical protein JTE90_027873 [Oedothorax gibbosus]